MNSAIPTWWTDRSTTSLSEVSTERQRKTCRCKRWSQLKSSIIKERQIFLSSMRILAVPKFGAHLRLFQQGIYRLNEFHSTLNNGSKGRLLISKRTQDFQWWKNSTPFHNSSKCGTHGTEQTKPMSTSRISVDLVTPSSYTIPRLWRKTWHKMCTENQNRGRPEKIS